MRMEFRLPDLSHLGPPSEADVAVLDQLAGMYPSMALPPLKFSEVLALTLAIAPQSEFDMWDFLRGTHGLNYQDNALLDDIVGGAYRFFRDSRLVATNIRVPDAQARAVLEDLAETVRRTPADLELMTSEVYDCGKRHYAQNELRSFFQTVYECLLGQESGPRLPTYVIMLGKDRFLQLVSDSLAREVE